MIRVLTLLPLAPQSLNGGFTSASPGTLPHWLYPHYFQELLEEVRKELQKVKEEIIEGEVFSFLNMYLFWRHGVPWKALVLEGRRGRGSAPDLCPLFLSSLCSGAEEAGCPLTTGPQKIQFLLSAHPLCLSPCFPCLNSTWNWLCLKVEEEKEQNGHVWLVTVLFPTSRRSQTPESQPTVVSESPV